MADITYVPTWAGFLYLAVVLDAFSRRIVGWAMATTLPQQLVLDALNMALATRRPRRRDPSLRPGLAVYLHRLRRTLPEAGVRPSMGSVGDAYDNAMARASSPRSNASCSTGAAFKTQAEARIAVFEFIEGFYNPRRRHSSLGYLSPIDYERHQTQQESIPAHTTLPPCSGRSRCGLEMSERVSTPVRRPTLTAPARAGVTDAQAGTEERAPQGPNRETVPKRRTT